MASFDYDAHLANYAGFDETVRVHMVQFLETVLRSDESEGSHFPNYQIPFGSLDRSVFHLLHWPPTYNSSKPWSSFDFDDSYSLRLVLNAFPGCREEAFFHDMFCVRSDFKRLDGSRKTNDEIYRSEQLLRQHQSFTSTLLEASAAEVIIVWGGAARKWFEETYDCEIVENDLLDKYRIEDGIMVGEKEVCPWKLSSILTLLTIILAHCHLPTAS